jgi:hypothetical protein
MGYLELVTDTYPDMATRLLTKPRAILSMAILVAIMAAGAYAFTATNTVPGTTAGSGSGTVSGYTASSVNYVLNTDPTKVDTITFTVAPITTTTVKVKYTNAGTWTTCSNNGSGSITCDYSASPITLGAIDNLTVVAVQ